MKHAIKQKQLLKKKSTSHIISADLRVLHNLFETEKGGERKIRHGRS